LARASLFRGNGDILELVRILGLTADFAESL
jgi:hypothetical protein